MTVSDVWQEYTDVSTVTARDLQIALDGVGGPIPAMVAGLNEVEIGGFMARVPQGRVLWTRGGKRVTIIMSGGGVIASCSSEPDPTRPMTPKAPEKAAT